MPESKPHSELHAEMQRCHREDPARYGGMEFAQTYYGPIIAGLEEQFESVLSLAEHLFQMIPQEVWREHGAEWMGQYEGDHHAEKVLEQLRAWRDSNPATKSHPDSAAITRAYREALDPARSPHAKWLHAEAEKIREREASKPHSELHERLHDFRKLVNRKDLTAPEVYREWAILHGEIDGLIEQLEALGEAIRLADNFVQQPLDLNYVAIPKDDWEIILAKVSSPASEPDELTRMGWDEDTPDLTPGSNQESKPTPDK